MYKELQNNPDIEKKEIFKRKVVVLKEQTTNLLDEECAIKLRAMETKYDMTLCLVKEVLFKRRRLI